MEKDRKLLLELIRHIKDMFIITQLYESEYALNENESILEVAAKKVADWELDEKKAINPTG